MAAARRCGRPAAAAAVAAASVGAVGAVGGRGAAGAAGLRHRLQRGRPHGRAAAAAADAAVGRLGGDVAPYILTSRYMQQPSQLGFAHQQIILQK